MTNFWWVNQGVTAQRKQDFTFLWAAYKDGGNKSQPNWDSLEDVEEDDVVIHYANGYVIGSSQVERASQQSIRPPAFELANRTGDLGREVRLNRFSFFDIPVPLESIPVELRRSQRGEGRPFDVNGDVQRGYLYPITAEQAASVFENAGQVISPSQPEVPAEAGTGDTPADAAFLDFTETDGVAVVKYRLEQDAVRRKLFAGRDTATCGICNREYPVAFLHAAHIKARAACSQPERVDWKNVVMAACLFGCDAMFEAGLLHVDKDGIISLRHGYDQTGPLTAFAKALAGRRASAHTDANHRYFEWRNKQGVNSKE